MYFFIVCGLSSGDYCLLSDCCLLCVALCLVIVVCCLLPSVDSCLVLCNVLSVFVVAFVVVMFFVDRCCLSVVRCLLSCVRCLVLVA